MKKDISMDAWIAELNRVSEQVAGQDGATCKEMAEAAGCDIVAIRGKIRRAMELGEWEHVKVMRKKLNGTVHRTDGYRPIAKKKK